MACTKERSNCLGLFSVTVLVIGTAPLRADDWPQFRGPNCTGISNSSRPLPVEFSATKHVRWSADLGDAVSSATVADGRVFSTAMIGEPGQQKFAVFAFDAVTGRKLWQRAFDTGPKPLPPIE